LDLSVLAFLAVIGTLIRTPSSLSVLFSTTIISCCVEVFLSFRNLARVISSSSLFP
jgi:hypothetical protein